MYVLCNYMVKMFKEFLKNKFGVCQLKIETRYHLVVVWNCGLYLLVTSE